MPGLWAGWAKSNLDGSADRRFHNNYQIPIALYGEMRFSTVTGLKEAYLASNCDAAAAFSQAYGRVQAAIRTLAETPTRLDRFTDGAPGIAPVFPDMAELPPLPAVRSAHEYTALALALTAIPGTAGLMLLKGGLTPLPPAISKAVTPPQDAVPEPRPSPVRDMTSASGRSPATTVTAAPAS